MHPFICMASEPAPMQLGDLSCRGPRHLVPESSVKPGGSLLSSAPNFLPCQLQTMGT